MIDSARLEISLDCLPGVPFVFDLGSPSSPLEPPQLGVVLLSDHPSEAGPFVHLVGLPVGGFGLYLKVHDVLEKIWLNSITVCVALRVDSKYEASLGLKPVSLPDGPAICISKGSSKHH